jgi:light-regulated signal transduction histidine kinase (bacteriophytochrome)/ActR/RegA family two-component response regulator
VLLALDPVSLKIVQLAGDTPGILGQTHEQLLGQSLQGRLGAAVSAGVASIVRRNQGLPRPFCIFEAPFDGAMLEFSAHLSGGLLVLEVEPRPRGDPFDAIEAVQAMVARADSTHSLSDLLDSAVAEVGAATGFDRVMLYRFREDDSGHVVAEHRRSAAVASFLDLHYPASDIPAQARELYCNNWIRTIPDVAYQPQPLSPPDNPKTGRPLDLSFSALRSVSPVHLEYLTNMGIAASMSLSLVVGGKLWGLIACHHNEPLYLSARTRAAMELFAHLVSLEIRGRIDLAESVARVRARDVQAELVVGMTAAGLPQLAGAKPNLLDLISVPGAALVVADRIVLLGRTPTVAAVKALAEWLGGAMGDGLYVSDHLGEDYPDAAALVDSAAGVLALSISRTPRDYVIWFLPEMIGAVTWAGEPTKALVHGPLGDRLTPRKSFAAWTEMVQGRSRPWTDVEIESAKGLGVAVLDVVLRQMDRSAREQEVVAKDQRDLLMAELDHRVKNTLGTIQAVVRVSGRHAENIVEFSRALERRIGAMAKSHSLLTTGRWLGAPLRALIEDELSSHRARGHASVQLVGDDVDLDPKAAMAVGLVLHELATNAVKHGSLSVEGGAVSLKWYKVRRDGADWLTLAWRETGGPHVAMPTRSGFGRTLLERVFAADVQGRATLEFRPDGLRCDLDIPGTHLVAPAEIVAPPATLVSLAAPTEVDKSLAGLTVLVVEDGGLIAMELCDTLVRHGAQVIGPCSNIEEALAAAARESFDVALLDVDLNGTPVWPVAELLVERRIPFVFATGFTDATLRPKAFRNVRTLHKPYDADNLLSMMITFAASNNATANPAGWAA